MYILTDKIIEVWSDDFRNFIAKSKNRERDINNFVTACEFHPMTRRVYVSNTRFNDLERAHNHFKAILEAEYIFNKNVFEDRHKFFTFKNLELLEVVFEGSNCIEFNSIEEVNELTGKKVK